MPTWEANLLSSLNLAPWDAPPNLHQELCKRVKISQLFVYWQEKSTKASSAEYWQHFFAAKSRQPCQLPMQYDTSHIYDDNSMVTSVFSYANWSLSLIFCLLPGVMSVSTSGILEGFPIDPSRITSCVTTMESVDKVIKCLRVWLTHARLTHGFSQISPRQERSQMQQVSSVCASASLAMWKKNRKQRHVTIGH